MTTAIASRGTRSREIRMAAPAIHLLGARTNTSPGKRMLFISPSPLELNWRQRWEGPAMVRVYPARFRALPQVREQELALANRGRLRAPCPSRRLPGVLPDLVADQHTRT